MRPRSVVYELRYVLQPADPLSVPSTANVAVTSVPGKGLASASPVWIAVASQLPMGVAGSYRRSLLLVLVEEDEARVVRAPVRHLPQRVEVRALDRVGGRRAGDSGRRDRPDLERVAVDSERRRVAVAAGGAADRPAGERRAGRRLLPAFDVEAAGEHPRHADEGRRLSGGDGRASVVATTSGCQHERQQEHERRAERAHLAPTLLQRLPEDRGVAWPPVRVEGVVGDHSDPRPAEPLVEALGGVARDGVEHQQRLALRARRRLGSLHQMSCDAAPPRRAANEELRDLARGAAGSAARARFTCTVPTSVAVVERSRG